MQHNHTGILLHWAARILGGGLLALYLALMLGEGAPPVRAQTAAMYTALLGIALAWHYEAAGGIVTLAGAAWFYAMEHASTGRWPGGWVFPLFWVAGALFLLSALTRRSFGR
jgi:hypothetical protein